MLLGMIGLTSCNKGGGGSSSSAAEWSSGSGNDKLLQTYEEYIEKYISFYEKMAEASKSGDIAAISALSSSSEYVEVMNKAQELDKELEKVKDQLTPEQIAKFNALHIKYAQSLQNALQK